MWHFGPAHSVAAFQRNLNIRGVDLLSYNGGVTSAAHTEEDIAQTLVAFRETIRTMLDEQILARLLSTVPAPRIAPTQPGGQQQQVAASATTGWVRPTA